MFHRNGGGSAADLGAGHLTGFTGVVTFRNGQARRNRRE